MIRLPSCCFLAIGLAAMALPAATTVAAAADGQVVPLLGTGRGTLFPDPTAPQSRLLVDPPPMVERRHASQLERMKDQTSPQPVAASARTATDQPSESLTVTARAGDPIVQPPPTKPAAPESAEPRPAPTKPNPSTVPAPAATEAPPKAVPLGPASKPEPAVQDPPSTTQLPEPPPLPDLPPARTADGPSSAPESRKTATGSGSTPPVSTSLQAGKAVDGDILTVVFPPNAAEPSDASSSILEAVATQLNTDPTLRLRLNAYAPGTEAEESRSRRLSLSRALAVRSRLVEAGVSSTRIEVRALGNAAPEGASADRVDIIVLER